MLERDQPENKQPCQGPLMDVMAGVRHKFTRHPIILFIVNVGATIVDSMDTMVCLVPSSIPELAMMMSRRS